MALTITIKGNGTVDKVVDGNSTTLTAKPSEGWNFKYFQIGSDEIKDNPYSFEAVGEEEVLATFYMSIVSYLKGNVGFKIPDSSLDSILADRGINTDTDIYDLTVEQRELLYADVLMWGTTMPTAYSGAKESDGGWSHTGETSTIQKADKERWYNIAQEVYNRYNDPKKAKSKIKLINLW